MNNQDIRTAVIEGFDNAPPLDTDMPIGLQFAVTLGVVSADAWLELKGAVRLHDYAAVQAEQFVQMMRAGMQADGGIDGRLLNESCHAFAAGLMGRIQQHTLAALGIVTRDRRTTH